MIGYSLLFLTFVYKSGLFTTPSVSSATWASLLLIKIFAALAYNWLHKEIPTFYDSRIYFREGNIVFSALAENPWYYLQLLLCPNNYFPEPEHLCGYIDQMGLWYDYTGYTIIRVNAFIRLFSFGFLSVHFLFFSFISFIGSFYLFKFFAEVTDLSEYAILAVLFMIPGVVFWTSGLHKEALIIFATGIVLYNVHQLSLFFTRWRAIVVFFTFLFLINVRMYMFLVLVPALIAYYWNEKSKIPAVVPYLVTYGFLLLTVVLYDVLVPNEYRLAYLISDFQNSFIGSEGNTSFEVEKVSNSWVRILGFLPEHFLNSFIHPVYNQCISDWCRLASMESIALCCLFIAGVLKTKYKYLLNNSIALFCLSIGFSLMVIIGVVVNNAGAIVRYRSIAIIFILTGLLLSSCKMSKNG